MFSCNISFCVAANPYLWQYSHAYNLRNECALMFLYPSDFAACVMCRYTVLGATSNSSGPRSCVAYFRSCSSVRDAICVTLRFPVFCSTTSSRQDFSCDFCSDSTSDILYPVCSMISHISWSRRTSRRRNMAYCSRVMRFVLISFTYAFIRIYDIESNRLFKFFHLIQYHSRFFAVPPPECAVIIFCIICFCVAIQIPGFVCSCQFPC